MPESSAYNLPVRMLERNMFFSLYALLLAVAAVILLPPFYRVSATLQPGWLRVAGDRASMVENEIFNAEVVKALGLDLKNKDIKSMEMRGVRLISGNIRNFIPLKQKDAYSLKIYITMVIVPLVKLELPIL